MGQEMAVEEEEMGCYENLMRELAFEDPEGYRLYMRIDTDAFELLLSYVSPLIAKRNTVLREAIPTAERLALTLRYLATGETQTSLHFQFHIEVGSICGIIMEVCSAIYATLKSQVMQTPMSSDEWRDISNEFWMLWNFPNCLGAMDGKYVKISPPPNSGSTFYNYKGDYSIVLLALVDAKL